MNFDEITNDLKKNGYCIVEKWIQSNFEVGSYDWLNYTDKRKWTKVDLRVKLDGFKVIDKKLFEYIMLDKPIDKIKEEVYSNARRKQVSMSCFISEFSLSDLFTDEVLKLYENKIRKEANADKWEMDIKSRPKQSQQNQIQKKLDIIIKKCWLEKWSKYNYVLSKQFTDYRMGQILYQASKTIGMQRPGYLEQVNSIAMRMVAGLYSKELKILQFQENSNLQVYHRGSYIAKHMDGYYDVEELVEENRIAVFFIYLSDKTGEGGDLMLRNRSTGEDDTYSPKFGDLILCDFVYGNNIEHSITPTYWERVTWVNFVNVMPQGTPVYHFLDSDYLG